MQLFNIEFIDKNKIFEWTLKKLIEREIKKDYRFNNYKYFHSVFEINQWSEKNDFCLENLCKRTNNCLNSSLELQSTIELYSGRYHEFVNDFLRDKTHFDEVPKFINETIYNLDYILKNSKTSENLIVVRRFDVFFFNDKLKRNEIFIDKGYLSSSLNLLYRLDIEGNYREIENEVFLILKVPRGVNAIYIERTSRRSEYELLINRNQKIKVLRNIKVYNNRIVFDEII